MNSQPVVYVVEDDPMLLRVTRSILQAAGYSPQVHASAEEFMAAYDPSRPGCLVLDLHMAGLGGLGLIDWLHERGHALPTIVVSATEAVPDAIRAMKGGAMDFLRKPVAREALLTAVKRALARAEDAFQKARERDALAREFAALSPRETQVMEQVAAGMPNREIARTLGISERTIEVHRSQVMRKLGVNSVAELVAKRLALRAAPAES